MKPNQNRQIAQAVAKAVAEVLGGKQPGKGQQGRRGGRKAPRNTDRRPGRGQQTQTQKVLDSITKTANAVSDDRAYSIVTSMLKVVGPQVVEIAREHMLSQDPSTKVSSIGLTDLSYGQIKASAPKALAMAAENHPDVFSAEFSRDLQHILNRISNDKSGNAFNAMRSRIRGEAAIGKLNVDLVAYYHLTTGKNASLAVRGLKQMSEKPFLVGDDTSFAPTSAQQTFQTILKKHGANLNGLVAKHEDDVRAICFYAYGPKEGRQIWNQFCNSQIDRVKVAQIRSESSIAQLKVRKSA